MFRAVLLEIEFCVRTNIGLHCNHKKGRLAIPMDEESIDYTQGNLRSCLQKRCIFDNGTVYLLRVVFVSPCSFRQRRSTSSWQWRKSTASLIISKNGDLTRHMKYTEDFNAAQKIHSEELIMKPCCNSFQVHHNNIPASDTLSF